MANKEAEDFRSSLCDLTVNSKPLISMLTMLADENQAHAEQIVKVIETHILQAKPTEKLPSLYLIDSILKNLRSTKYASFFQQIIVNVFCHVFEQVDERTRQSMFKLRQTWSDILHARKLYALDVRVNQIDPAWPVSQLPDSAKEPTSPSSIHVNPKFLHKSKSSKPTASVAPSSSAAGKTDMVKLMEEKQKELEVIQQMQIELELAKAKAKLEAQQRELEELQARLRQNPSGKPAPSALPAPPAAEAPLPTEPLPTDPRLHRSKAAPLLPASVEPSIPVDPRKAQVPSDPRRAAAASAPAAGSPSLNIPLPSINQTAAKPERQLTAPPASSVGALLNQAVADQALERLDSPDPKSGKKKSSKSLKLKETEKEDTSQRGFSGRGGYHKGSKRPFNSRDEQWNSRGRHHSYSKTERLLPYDRPSTSDKSKSRDESESSSRRRRRDRSRSRSRSSRSRSRSLSPRRESRKSSKKKESRSDKTSSDGKPRKTDKSESPTPAAPNKSTTVAVDDDALSAETTVELDRKLSKDKFKDSKSTELSSSTSKPAKEDKSKFNEDVDMRKRKKSPEPKRKSDSKSPEESITWKKARKASPVPRISSPSQRNSPSKKRTEALPAQDEDLRKKDSTAAPVEKDEDLRSNRDKLVKEQWESSKAKQMPRIPKRKVKAHYRERDDTSPLKDISPPIEGGLLEAPDQDEKVTANKSDVDLRSLPMVRAPSRSDTDSSDSDAEVLATLDKRRKQRNKIVEGGKASRDSDDKSGGNSKGKHGDVDMRVTSRDKKRRKRQEETFDEDEDFRIRPPQPKSKPSDDDKEDTDLRKKLSIQINKDDNDGSVGDQDEDLRVPPSPASHNAWNKFKEANPKDFYTPDKVQSRRNSDVTPLHMNDKGLDLLDQKDLIVGQAHMQYKKGEITKEQFMEVKHRIQELELIKRAHQVKAGSMLGSDRRQRMNNPYDQRGGGPMIIQRQLYQNMQRQQVSPVVRPNLDPRMVALLLAIRNNSDDRRLKMFLGKLQGARGSGEGSMSPNQGRSGGLLPTPDSANSSGTKKSLSRTSSSEMTSKSRNAVHEFVIDGQPFELELGTQPRKVPIGGRTYMVHADSDNREITLDGSCYYKIGDRVRVCYFGGNKHEIFYRGPLVNFWLDQIQTDVRIDAPPLDIRIDGNMHTIQVEGHSNTFLVDGRPMGQFGGKPRDIFIGGRRHFIAFEAPPREILIDGKLCRLQSDGPTPVIIIDNKAHGIRFDGPPREIAIDDMSFMVPMDRPMRVKIGRRAHMLAFGGPGQEVIIDGKAYEVMFSGPPRVVKIGGTSRDVRLVGDPPEVKILGEILPDDINPANMATYRGADTPRDQGPASHFKPLAPPPRPPVRAGGLLPTPPALPQMFNADSDMRIRPNYPMRPPGSDPGPPHRHRDDRGPMRDSRGPPSNHDFNQPNFGPPHGRPGDFPPAGHHMDPRDPRNRQRSDFNRGPPGRDFREDVKPDVHKPPPGFFPNFPPPGLGTNPPAAGDPRQQQPPSSSQQAEAPSVPAPLDIGSLFKKLLDHGIINKKEEVDKMEKIPDLSSLSDELLKQKYTGVIQRLYTGNQCATCGLRFLKSADTKYNDHLDWHFRQNTKERNRSVHGTSRNWYIQVEDWVSYEEFSDVAESNVFLNTQTEGTTSAEGAAPVHPEAVVCPKATGTDDDNCCVCREPFERYWDDDEEEWHLKDAVRVQDKTYHPVCYEDAVETSIMESSLSVEEMPAAMAASGSVPQSPRTSIPPQSPRTPLLSPTSSHPPPGKEALQSRRESNSSSGTSAGPQSPKIVTPKAEPATAFDLLSGLISKTEAKPSPSTPQQGAKDDPFQMLAGLMKTVKPPPGSELKGEPIEKSQSTLPEASSVKQEVVNVKETEKIAVKPIGTIGGFNTPITVKSNVTLLPPQDVGVAAPEGSLHQPFPQGASRAPLRHQPTGQPPARIRPEFTEPTDPSHQILPPQMQHPQGPPAHQGAPRMQPRLPMPQGGPGQGPSAGAQRPSMQQEPPTSAQRPPMQQGPPGGAHRPPMQQVPSASAQRPPMQHGPPAGAQRPPMQQAPPTGAQRPLMQQGSLPQFRGISPMSQQGPLFPGIATNQAPVGHLPPNVSGPPMLMNRPPIVRGPPAMMALAGAPSHMMMSSMPPTIPQTDQGDDDEGTPVRDERDDGVGRCATPVMDEPGDDGGSTPVRDEWD